MAMYRIETNGTLTLANSYTYGTWGRPTTATHNSIADLGFRFLYVGAWDVQWDSTYGLDLLYMHVRHYSPSLGRFLQADPSRLELRLFVYAKNGPVGNVDPDGRVTRNVNFDHPTLQSDARTTLFDSFDSDAAWAHSTSVLYTGPTATIRASRTIRYKVFLPEFSWTGSMTPTVPGTGGQHNVYTYMALVDVTRGIRLQTIEVFSSQNRCVTFGIGGIGLLCSVDGWSDTLDIQAASASYRSTSRVIRNHRYRIDYWQVAIAKDWGALVHTGVDSRDIWGQISW